MLFLFSITIRKTVMLNDKGDKSTYYLWLGNIFDGY